ncbi:MAG TPA: DUF6428 family protein, partial [Verrucomicrobiaceae bacterium]
LRVLLPDGSPIPASFHVTEVGKLERSFLDCGGKVHRDERCLLQLWIGPDDDHRVSPGKLASILQRARPLLPDQGLPVDVEYGNDAAMQYPVAECLVETHALMLRLGHKRTDCLAKNECGVSEAASPCCGSGCGCR